MKRGNNVFKLSGNLALGSGNDYLNDKSLNSVSNLPEKRSSQAKGVSSYQQQKNYYESSEQMASQKYGYDRLEKRNTGSSIRENINANNNHPSYNGQYSQKTTNPNYQPTLNKMSVDKKYSAKNHYEDVEKYSVKYNNNYGGSRETNSQKRLSRNQPVSSTTATSNSYSNIKSGKQSAKYGYEKEAGSYDYDSNNYLRHSSKQFADEPTHYQKSKNGYNTPTMSKPSAKNSKLNPQPTSIQREAHSNYKYDAEEDYSNDVRLKGHSREEIKQYDPSTFVACRQGCGRKFNPDSISKHEKICKKVFQNKRKAFNAQQHRLVEQQQKKLMRQGAIVEKKLEQKKKVESKKQNVPKWKAESLGFRAILKANRKDGQMSAQEQKIINQAQESNTVKCKFCGRTFNPEAGKRHIVFCESQQKKNAMKRPKK